MFSNSPFEVDKKNIYQFSPDSELVFVSDMFVKDYVGGAELTSQALIDSCPLKIDLIHSRDVNMDVLERGVSKYWIFGNFAALDINLIPSIIANLKYSVLEYDYKYCRYRSPEKHKHIENIECDCRYQKQGKLISAFYHGSKNLWFMSEKQHIRYCEQFPTLENIDCAVLSSVFDENFFMKIKDLREKNTTSDRSGWIVLGSTSWIKGAKAAENWCIENKKDFEILWGIPYSEVLDKLSSAEGFVYLPEGGDTCPRMVIEAKLLGCKLHLNNNVEHSNELWFNTDDMFDTEAYLYAARERFWSAITSSMHRWPTISGYTTTKNCIDQRYPWRQSIQSMLGFCDEVVVVDGGSDDGTWEELESWSSNDRTAGKLKVFKIERDWNDSRFAVFDGLQKAEARSRCTSEFLWQQDADEVVHENDYKKIRNLCKNFPRGTTLLCLPVIEYWGSPEKIRCDINPWKWRLSINHPNITHGIPKELRRLDSSGKLYAAQGTDGCDYVTKDEAKIVPYANFYTEEIHNIRIAALSGNSEALEHYRSWYQSATDQLPGVYHYSWIDIERKMYTYKNYWQKHWESLYDIKQEDTSENNKFFNKPWAQVSDSDISAMSTELATKMGGWIFHTRVDFSKPTPHVILSRDQPRLMLEDEN